MDPEDEVYVGCGNVFADLGLPDAEELFLKSYLSLEIKLVIKDKRLSRQRAADRMGITKEQLIALMNRNPFDYSIDQLVNYLRCLGQEVKISVSVTDKPSSEKRLNGTRPKKAAMRREETRAAVATA